MTSICGSRFWDEFLLQELTTVVSGNRLSRKITQWNCTLFFDCAWTKCELWLLASLAYIKKMNSFKCFQAGTWLCVLSLPINLLYIFISCKVSGSLVIVYYVEGDGGHLLNEIMGQPGFRTAVRGSYESYSMPWEEIMEDLPTCVLQLGLMLRFAWFKVMDKNTDHN